MDKVAPVNHPILDEIKRRWSPRALSSKTIPSEVLLSVFEAGRWAPSCFNDQPWFYIVAEQEKKEKFQDMLSCLVEKNQLWAKNAALLAIAVARINFSQRDRENRHATHDVGLSIMNMMIEATAHDLYIHAMAGFSIKRTKELYRIPEGYEPVTALAMGFAGDPETLPEDMKGQEFEKRERKPLESFLFEGSWGKPWEKVKSKT